MGIAKEIIDQESKLRKDRSTYDSHCKEVAELMLPRQDQFFEDRKTEGDKRTEKIISSVAAEALNKFSAAMESILTPRASQWHKLSTGNEELDQIQEVSEYMDSVTKILFKKRYASTANFASQKHEGYMSLGAFGTEVMMTQEDTKNRGIKYMHSHISEHSFMLNDSGIVDKNYRKYKLTARQAAMKWGEDNLHHTIKKAIKNEPHTKFDFIHCVMPNEDMRPSAKDASGMEFTSFHVSVEGSQLLHQGGFRTFPYHIARYVTAPNEKYGRSVAMTALPEVKMVNAMRKTDLRARHQAVSPPLLTSSERGLRRPIMKPDGVNYGALDERGNELIKPFNNQARIDVSNDALSQSYELINDIFLVTLFQILVDTPTMTATEVLQRAQEKGALLSPTAGRQQSEMLGPMIEREIDILNSMGELPPMPQALIDAGGEYEIIYTAPLNVMQKSGEAAAATAVVNDAIPLMELDPSLRHKIDFNEYMNVMRDARGAPAKLFRSDEEIDAINEQEQQQQQIAGVVEAAPQVSGAIKDIAQAEAALSG